MENDLRTIPVLDEKYENIRHPYADYGLGEAIALAINNAKISGSKAPATLLEVREFFVKFQPGAGRQWLEGYAALDVLDAAIDGRDLAVDCRLLPGQSPMVFGYAVMKEHTLGIIFVGHHKSMHVLSGDKRGHDWRSGCVSTFGAEIRPATIEDFNKFRVVVPPDFVGERDKEIVASPGM